jgi:EKC/KEOPS complex subunit CGI121/TPRKB
MDPVQLEHLPSDHCIHLALFKNVANADFLQSCLIARDPEFEYAFIDASSVCSSLAPEPSARVDKISRLSHDCKY